MAFDVFTIAGVIILIFSAVLHEVAHGAMADSLGDPTAKMAGRLTLNPLKHLDWFGSVILPILLIAMNSRVFLAWAKPVPFNPYLLRDQKWGPAKIAIAGPLSNFAIALVFGLLLRFWPLGMSEFSFNLVQIFALVVIINLSLAVFNLMPIPPLDGSHILFSLMPRSWEQVKIFLMGYGSILLLIFVFFFTGFIYPIVSTLFRLIVGASIT